MKKIYLSLLILVALSTTSIAQQYKRDITPVKNVILMVPDGTSTSVLSVARWYQFYNTQQKQLNLDPYLCGLVQTYSSNSPIPDSAPAMSAYMTGIPSRKGNVSIYPEQDLEQDIFPVEAELAYQPLVTVFEAARLFKNKATGIVVTCEFCHATPSACTAHHYNRNEYKSLAPQMAYSKPDVVFGGGYAAVTDDMRKYFENQKVTFIENDTKTFRNFSGREKVWALFTPKDMPYDLDRAEEEYPSLAEMTEKAIERLDKEENGFFLMVEGSRVDKAAHATDPVGITTEFLAFDKAVGIAMEYAKKNGETAVVVLPDHGNSGFSFGSREFNNFSERGLQDSFGNISKYRKTAKGLEGILLKTKPEDIKKVFKEETDIDLTDEEVELLLSSKNYKTADYMQVGNTVNMVSSIAHIMTAHTYFSFVSATHTGEDVFLAAYHPQGNLPSGLNTNVEINQYLCDLVGLDKTLMDYTKEVFVKHTDVFKNFNYSIDKSGIPTLTIKKGKSTLSITASKSIYFLNGYPYEMESIAVYIDKNNTFYLPAELADKL